MCCKIIFLLFFFIVDLICKALSVSHDVQVLSICGADCEILRQVFREALDFQEHVFCDMLFT